MHLDICELRAFYADPLGEVARRQIRRRIREFWPDLHGRSLLGLGYPLPFLGPFAAECERAVVCMPAQQGVMRWPADGPNLVALGEETRLPLDDSSMDRILMVHSLEYSEQQAELLQDVWRVLKGDGRLLLVVPNRRGVWARFDDTPFGFGVPFSSGQVNRLLRHCQFFPERDGYALYAPPARRALALSASACEQIGRRWFPVFGGVVLVEASKQVFASVRSGRKALRPSLLVPSGARPAGIASPRRIRDKERA